MKQVLSAIIICVFALSAKAQNMHVLTQSADNMKDAVLCGDLVTLAAYTHPAVGGAGGKEQIVAAIKKGMEDMEQSGASFRSVKIGAPGKFFRTPEHIFSLLPQSLLINIKDGYLETKTSMLAISDDQGKSWKFMSAGNLDWAQLKSVFPDLPAGLEIPKQTQPVFHKN